MPSATACPRCSAALASRSSRRARGCSPTSRRTRRAWVGKSSPTSGKGAAKMSRIGRLPIAVPGGVDIAIDGQTVNVKGPKGSLSHTVAAPITVERDEDGTLRVARPNDERESRALHGLSRTLIANMITGVTEGYTKTLEIVGVGY